MDITGQRIYHLVYGSGTILEKNGQKVTIRFDDEERERIIGAKYFEEYITFFDETFNCLLETEEYSRRLIEERIEREKQEKEILLKKSKELREEAERNQKIKNEQSREEKLKNKALHNMRLIEFCYEGKIYYRIKSGWADSEFSLLSKEIQDKIENEYCSSYKYNIPMCELRVYQDPIRNILPADLSSINRKDLLKFADNLKNDGDYEGAALCYKKLILNRDYNECKYIYPKLLSCFRNTEEPEKVFQLLKYIEKVHGKEAVTRPLLTSAAAAFCDMNLPTKAAEYAHLAYNLDDGGKPEYLDSVIVRIKYLFSSEYYEKYPEFFNYEYELT